MNVHHKSEPATQIDTMMAGMKMKVTSQESGILLMPPFPVLKLLHQTSVAGEGRAAGPMIGVLTWYPMKVHQMDSAADNQGNQPPHMTVNNDTRVGLK